MNVCTSSALGTLLIGSLSVILERVPPLCHAFSCHSIEKCGKFAHDEQLSHDVDPYLGFLGSPSVAENDHHVLFFYKFNRPALKVVCALHHFCKFNHFYRLPLTIVLPAHLTTYFRVNNNHNPTTTTTVATSALATPTTTRATTAATNDGKP